MSSAEDNKGCTNSADLKGSNQTGQTEEDEHVIEATNQIPTEPEETIAKKVPCSLRACSIIVAGCLIHLTLGTLYTYGNLSSYMISYIRQRSSPSNLRYVDGIWVQACMMIGQGITMFIGGLIERKLGPRLTTLIGSWTMSAGVLLTYFTIQHSYIATVFTFGVMFGMGTGIAYPIPLGCAMKWLPERSGLVSAIILAGFGCGAVVFNQVITAYINPDNYSPDRDIAGEQYFSQEEVLNRVPFCFLILGGTYATIQLLCCLILVDPPEENKTVHNDQAPVCLSTDDTDMKNKAFVTEMSTTDTNTQIVEAKEGITIELQEQPQDVHPLKVLRTKNFYLLWLLFLCGGEGIVFISSQYKNYGQTFITDDLFLAVVGSVSSIVSAVACIFWGLILDRFAFKITARCIYIGFTVLIVSFLGCQYAGKVMFFIWVCLFFFHFSGVFTIMPPAISRWYGNTFVGVNFGLLFTSQIITGVTSAFLGQILKDSIGWNGLFLLSAGFATLGFILIFFMDIKTPARKCF